MRCTHSEVRSSKLRLGQSRISKISQNSRSFNKVIYLLCPVDHACYLGPGFWPCRHTLYGDNVRQSLDILLLVVINLSVKQRAIGYTSIEERTLFRQVTILRHLFASWPLLFANDPSLLSILYRFYKERGHWPILIAPALTIPGYSLQLGNNKLTGHLIVSHNETVTGAMTHGRQDRLSAATVGGWII